MTDVAPWSREPAIPLALDAQDEGETPEHWRIRDDDAAEWAMGKLRAAQAQADTISRQYDVWRARLDEWAAESGRRALAEVQFFQGQLEAYALAQREATGDATLKLPSGKVSTTKHARTVVVTDEEALLAWARGLMLENDEGRLDPLDALFTRTVQRALVSELRELVGIVDELDPERVEYRWPCGCWVVVVSESEPTEWLGPHPSCGCPNCGEVGTVTRSPVTVPVVRAMVGPLFRADDTGVAALADEAPPVPGVAVQPEHVSAKVKPLPPAALASPDRTQVGSGQADTTEV